MGGTGQFLRRAAFAAGLALAMAAFAQGARASQISFSLLTAGGVEGCGRACQSVIVADGQIDQSAADRFEALMRAHPAVGGKGLTIVLNSRGGWVVAAIRLGEAFRRHGAKVVVARPGRLDRASLHLRLRAGQCVSACVYALMGGVDRIAPAGSSVVLHKAYARTAWWRPAVHDDELLVQYAIAHARKMGVSPEAVEFAESLPPSELRPATPAQLARWRLARDRF